MKTSVSTLGCPAMDLQQIVALVGQCGFNGIEFRFLRDQSELWKLPEFQGDGLVQTRRLLADHNLTTACVDTDCHFHWPDAAKRRDAVEEGVRMADIAAGLGAHGIRVFGDKIQPGQTREQTRRWTAEGMCALADRTHSLGVEVWIETHGDFANSHDVREILREANCPGTATVWDPENCYGAYFEKPADGARVLGSFIRHVHFKDIRRDANGEWVPALMGKGEFPCADVLSSLHRLHYDGFVSFEWEKKWHPEIPDAGVAFPQFMEWMRAHEKNA